MCDRGESERYGFVLGGFGVKFLVQVYVRVTVEQQFFQSTPWCRRMWNGQMKENKRWRYSLSGHKERASVQRDGEEWKFRESVDRRSDDQWSEHTDSAEDRTRGLWDCTLCECGHTLELVYQLVVVVVVVKESSWSRLEPSNVAVIIQWKDFSRHIHCAKRSMDADADPLLFFLVFCNSRCLEHGFISTCLLLQLCFLKLSNLYYNSKLRSARSTLEATMKSTFITLIVGSEQGKYNNQHTTLHCTHKTHEPHTTDTPHTHHTTTTATIIHSGSWIMLSPK